MKQHFTLFLAALMSMAGMNTWALEPNGEGVYEIGTAEDLVAFSELVNGGNAAAKAILTANIDMTGITYAPIGTEAIPYTGTFDGQGHRLAHLTVNVNTYAGVFGYVSGGATVKNLVLDSTCEINATTGGYAGIIGGSNGGGTVTMSRLGNEGKVTAAGPNAGGIIGVNMSSSATFLIENCYVTGTVAGENESGAITGWTGGNQSTIRNCWSTATVTGHDAGLPFFRPAGAAPNCYNLTGEQATLMTAEQLKSGEICYNLNCGAIENVAWYQTLDEDDLPVLDKTHKQVYWSGKFSCNGNIVPGSGTYTNTVITPEIPAHEYEDGICKNCGASDPNVAPPIVDGVCQIGSPGQLVMFSKLVNEGNYKLDAVLTADIDMSSVENFIPIAVTSENATAYQATFDGQCHTISNLTIHRDASNTGYVGLFSHVYKGVVKNLYLKTVNITTESAAPIATGAVMGRNGAATMLNVAAVDVTLNLAAEGDGTKTSHGGLTGALASSSSTRMENCFTNYPSFGYIGGNATIINSYAGEDVERMAPTGELCHTLNGDQSVILWYQTLGEDDYPVFDSTHKIVYGLGRMKCDGTPLVGELTYSNDPGSIEIPPHEYDHGFCVNCGFFTPDYKQPVDGFYELDDGMDVYWFSRLVNTGVLDINARLTDDVDMSSIENFPSIGNKKFQYKGIFDGDHHTVRNLYMDFELDYTGFLGAVGDGAALKNITFDSSCTVKGKSYSGGAVGGFYSGLPGEATIENVGFEGNVICTKNQNGGIFGSNLGADATLHISNCYMTGTVSGSTKSCAIAAWTGDNNRGTLVSCWSTADVINATDDASYMYRGSTNAERIFCTKGAQGTIVSDAQIKSGELAYMLNNSGVVNVGWYQDIGEDEHPVPDSSHGLVFPSFEGFVGINEYNFTTMRDYLLTQMNTEADGAIAYKPTIDAVMAAVDEIYHAEANDRDAFAEIYSAKLVGPINIFRESKAAYQSYLDIVAEAVKLSKEIGGTSAEMELLMNYLEGEAGPSELYPNGTYYYIIDQMQLTNDQIRQEGVFVRQMLESAIKNSYKGGDEITVLLKNADFSENATGWKLTAAGLNAQGTSSADNIKYVARFNSAPFSFSQTLTEMRDGIYELTAGGYTEVTDGTPPGQYNYVGFLFANDVHNFLNTRLSNLLMGEEFANLGDKAANFVRMDDYAGELMGYAPNSTLGTANAIDAGHYDNRILVSVTDGTLTVGGRGDGAFGLANSASFGALHLYYLGETESEAAISGMDDVLASMQGIATHIMEDYVFDFTEYAEAPNFYQGLMNDLTAAMEEVPAATTGAAKYALIERFSDIFQSMATCKTTYAKLMKTINELSDAYGNLATTEEQIAIANTINEALDAYTEGTATEEEANDLIDMMQADPYYIRQYGNAALVALLNEASTLSGSVKDLKALITSSTQFSSNCQWENEGSPDYLLDGNTKTYFHSATSMNVSSGEEYIQVDFGKPVSAFYLEFSGRSDGAGTGNSWHDTPDKIRIMASTDGTNWTETGIETYTLPNADGVHYMAVTPTDLGAEYTAVRLYILHTTSNMEYWNLSELQMYAPSADSRYNTLEGLKEAVDEMDAIVARINAGAAEKGDINALKAALAQTKEILATGIEFTPALTHREGAPAIYDLSGRRIKNRSNLPRGIYIVGGRKVMVR